jgi:tetratricopeptide (TPR) repeat protein
MLRTGSARRIAAAFAVGLVGLAAAAQLQAAGSEKKDKPAAPAAATGTPDPYALGMESVKEGDFTNARTFFEQAVRAKKDDPDALNMLAYTQRKTGRLQEAFANYARALELRPNFPQAREYLGEAHLQAALLELEALTAAGADGEKFRKQLTYALQQAASKHPTVTAEEAKAAGASDW